MVIFRLSGGSCIELVATMNLRNKEFFNYIHSYDNFQIKTFK